LHGKQMQAALQKKAVNFPWILFCNFCAISGSKALKNPLSSWTFSTYPWVLSESSGNTALNTRCASLRCLRKNCSVTVSQYSIHKNGYASPSISHISGNFQRGWVKRDN
jgi:hypothetical protein